MLNTKLNAKDVLDTSESLGIALERLRYVVEIAEVPCGPLTKRIVAALEATAIACGLLEDMLSGEVEEA